MRTTAKLGQQGVGAVLAFEEMEPGKVRWSVTAMSSQVTSRSTRVYPTIEDAYRAAVPCVGLRDDAVDDGARRLAAGESGFVLPRAYGRGLRVEVAS